MTNTPVFAEDMVIYQLGVDGQLHAHWQSTSGYFYTGLVYINGQVYNFDEECILLGIG